MPQDLIPQVGFIVDSELSALTPGQIGVNSAVTSWGNEGLLPQIRTIDLWKNNYQAYL